MSRDLANGNTTVAGGFSFSLNQPELHPTARHREPVSERRLRDDHADAVEDVDRAARLRARSTSPATRTIRTCAPTSTASWCWDRFPISALRQTLSARLRQALPGDTYLEADYRHYFDDWDVTSNTFSAGVSHHFGPQVLLNVVYRRYNQTGAYFWAPSYTGTPEFYTADFRLEPFASNTYTGRLVLTPKGSVVVVPRGHRSDRPVRALPGRQQLPGGHPVDGTAGAVEDPDAEVRHAVTGPAVHRDRGRRDRRVLQLHPARSERRVDVKRVCNAGAGSDTDAASKSNSDSAPTSTAVAYSDLQPVFATDCVPCHGASRPAGRYSMTSYSGVMAAVRAGSASSALVIVTQPGGVMYAFLSGDRAGKAAMIRTWVLNGAPQSR